MIFMTDFHRNFEKPFMKQEKLQNKSKSLSSRLPSFSDQLLVCLHVRPYLDHLYKYCSVSYFLLCFYICTDYFFFLLLKFLPPFLLLIIILSLLELHLSFFLLNLLQLNLFCSHLFLALQHFLLIFPNVWANPGCHLGQFTNIWQSGKAIFSAEINNFDVLFILEFIIFVNVFAYSLDKALFYLIELFLVSYWQYRYCLVFTLHTKIQEGIVFE